MPLNISIFPPLAANTPRVIMIDTTEVINGMVAKITFLNSSIRMKKIMNREIARKAPDWD